MKKILHVITSRHVISALFIIAELILLALLETYISHALFPVLVVNYILSLITLLTLINRNSIMETKLPWILTVLLIPAFGILIYWTLGRRYMTRKERKFIRRFNNVIKNHLESNKDLLNELEVENQEAANKLKQLVSESGSIIYKNVPCTFYKSGEACLDELLTQLKKAEKFIFMEFFIVSNGTVLKQVEDILVDKVKDGVEVYFMYDDVGSFVNLKSNYYKILRKKGVNASCFAKFNFMAVASHNNRNHRKIVVVDGKIAFTGGINLADEYFNIIERFGYWKDSVIKIQGQAVNELVSEFIFDWNLNNKIQMDINKYLSDNPIIETPGYVVPFTAGPIPIHKPEIPKHTFLNLINQAKKYIYLTTPYLINDRESISALENASKRGVEVIIITPHIPDKKIVFMLTRSSYKTLIEAGVKIYEFTPGFIHEKLIVVDDEYAMTGTLNYDYRCFLYHYENAVWLYKHPIINDMKDDVKEILQKSELYDLQKHKQNIFSKLFILIIRVFSPFF